jgi:hypothetical protein
MLRAAKRRRIATALTATFTVAALVSGATYAVASFGSGNSEIGPAQPTPTTSFAVPDLFFSSIAGERVSIAIQTQLGMVCYFGASVDDSLVTLEIVEGRESKTNVVMLRPTALEEDIPEQQGFCARELDGEALGRVVASPSDHFLLADRGSGEEIAALTSAASGAANPTCERDVAFHPTYLPPRWVGELQEGSAVGTDVIENVIGHYGNDAEPGSEQKYEDGFLDLGVSPIPYSATDGSDVQVLGSPATIEESEAGAWLSFGYEGCGYQLLGAGLPKRELIRFAEGLTDGKPASSDETERCRSVVDFEPTFLPDGWTSDLRPGEGGGGAFFGVLGHYTADASTAASDTQAGYVDLIVGDPPYQQSRRTTISVLGGSATLGDIHEGYSVEFEYEGCDFSLIAFGIARPMLKNFAEGLRR